ncbi:MAG TPA: ComF family protein [Burkholderiaceae bacterium]
MPLWSRKIRACADWLLPCVCALCGHDGEAAVCAPCVRRYFSDAAPRCLQCGLRLDAAPVLPARCGACLQAPPAFDATVAACDYAAPGDGLVLALKFGGALALGPWCARQLSQAARRQLQGALPDLLCPVPLGRARLAGRGYNQAAVIARPLGRLLGLSVAPSLALRVRDTQAQSSLPLPDRAANIRNAFALRADGVAAVAGKHIGVVDDVMTTGRTLNELAALLKRHGAARITAFVFARTP